VLYPGRRDRAKEHASRWFVTAPRWDCSSTTRSPTGVGLCSLA
jgi:hypothetical protein